MAVKIPACEDCGEYPVRHRVEWLGALIESAFTKGTAPFEDFVVSLENFLGKSALLDGIALPAFRLAAFLGLGALRTDADPRDSARTKILWEAAKRKGILMYQFSFLDEPGGANLFVAFKDGRARFFEGLPRPRRGGSASLAWMDNKAILKKKFLAAGIPMAKGCACFTYRHALKTMRDVGVPVITKPHIGSRSRHSTVRIMTPDELRAGFEKAKRLSPWVIVEQELRGYLFRVLLIDGHIGGIIRREVAHIVGDGVHTVRELFLKENMNPLRSGPTFHRLRDDEEASLELARQKRGWDDVPQKNEIVNLSSHISRWYGGSTTDFTERVHPDNAALFEHIAKTLDDSLVGVDFIMEDMERSWRDQKLCGVIECNSLPNIDLHHDVLCGKNHDIAGLLLDLAFA